MSNDTSFDCFDGTTLSNVEISSIFHRHREELFYQHWKMNDEIRNWMNSLIFQIEATANQQRNLLEQEYKNQQHYLEKKHQECLDKVHIYEKHNNNNEQIERLTSEFNALKFEVTALEYSLRSIPYLTPVTPDNPEHGRFPTKSIKRLENDTVTDINSTETLPPAIPPKNTKQKSERSLVRKPAIDGNPSGISPDNSTEECPICNMVFSLHMDASSRNRHAEEHFSGNREQNKSLIDIS